jgi:uncharacterized protein with HEPN domain
MKWWPAQKPDMRDDDIIRLKHMLDAAREAVSFTEGKSRKDFETDRKLVLSIVKSIEIIGEAARKLTTEGRESHPDIPWQDIIGMRNRLIHAYFDINLDTVWDTVTNELPPLIEDLVEIIEGS